MKKEYCGCRKHASVILGVKAKTFRPTQKQPEIALVGAPREAQIAMVSVVSVKFLKFSFRHKIWYSHNSCPKNVISQHLKISTGTIDYSVKYFFWRRKFCS